jgi:hypothetical protein
VRFLEPPPSERWVIHFKCNTTRPCSGCGKRQLMPVIPMPRTFGWSDSAEAALRKVEDKIKTDSAWAASWWRTMGPGDFLPVRVDFKVPMPDMTEIVRRLEAVTA